MAPGDTDGGAPAFLGVAPWIATEDLAATVAYYRDVLGFTGDWHWLWGDPPDHAGVSRGRVRIMFFEDPTRAARFEGTEVVIYVRDVARYYDEVRSRGTTILRPLGERPWGTFDFWLREPNGYVLIFTEAPESFE